MVGGGKEPGIKRHREVIVYPVAFYNSYNRCVLRVLVIADDGLIVKGCRDHFDEKWCADGQVGLPGYFKEFSCGRVPDGIDEDTTRDRVIRTPGSPGSCRSRVDGEF